MWMLDEASVRSIPGQTDDGESSGRDSEPNGDDAVDSLLSNDEERQSDDDDDDDDNVADTAAYSSELESDVMKQLGLQS